MVLPPGDLMRNPAWPSHSNSVLPLTVWAWLGVHPNAKQALFCAITILGVCVALQPPNHSHPHQRITLLGVLLAMIGATMGKIGNVDDLAGTAIYLASDASTFVTGQIIAVDGGFLAKGI